MGDADGAIGGVDGLSARAVTDGLRFTESIVFGRRTESERHLQQTLATQGNKSLSVSGPNLANRRHQSADSRWKFETLPTICHLPSSLRYISIHADTNSMGTLSPVSPT